MAGQARGQTDTEGPRSLFEEGSVFFGDWLQRRAWLSPNKTALIDARLDDKVITNQERNRRTKKSANYLRDGLEVRRGDRVSIYAMNRVVYLDAPFASNKLGAILHVLNWRLTPRELAPIVDDATPRVLLYYQHHHGRKARTTQGGRPDVHRRGRHRPRLGSKLCALGRRTRPGICDLGL